MSPTSPPVDKAVEESQLKEVAADLNTEEVRPSEVRLEDGEPDRKWRPVFTY